MLSHIWGIFSFFSSSFFSSAPPLPPATRPISQPQGPYPSLEAQILVLRLKSQPPGLNPHPKAQIPASRDLGLKTGIWALRLRYGPRGWREGGCLGEEEGENPPYIRFKSPDYSSQKGKRFTKQNKKVLNSLNRKIFRRASKLLQSHWPRRYFLSLHISKQKIICKSILS